MIPIYKPDLSGNEKLYVNQCLESTWISSKGEFINRFEHSFGDFIGSSFATSVCNGTVAIHLALAALGIGPGDEVIVPTFTYIASVNAIAQTGATPVFVDSLEPTWQIDPLDVVRKITAKTKAVMVVHLYGLPCDMDAITDICNKHNLLLIEDCAEALGTYFRSKHVGTFGDAATFSFFGNKTVTTGEGGMVVTKTQELLNRAFHLKNQGVSKAKEYWHDVAAYNYRMTNIAAALGLAQIERAQKILDKKRRIAIHYEKLLEGLPLKFHRETANTRHSYWMCSIALDDPSYRDSLRQHLRSVEIETRPTFYPAHVMPPYKSSQSFPVAESLGARGINLPSYPQLTDAEIALVANQISIFFEKGVHGQI